MQEAILAPGRWCWVRSQSKLGPQPRTSGDAALTQNLMQTVLVPTRIVLRRQADGEQVRRTESGETAVHIAGLPHFSGVSNSYCQSLLCLCRPRRG